jgi:hypothetical protein
MKARNTLSDEISLAIGRRETVCEMKDHKIESAIYILMKDGAVIYVGQTGKLIARIAQHSEKKVFDRVLYVECDIDNLNWMEGRLIKYFKPIYNTAQLTTKTDKAKTKAKAREWTLTKCRNLYMRVLMEDGATFDDAVTEAFSKLI